MNIPIIININDIRIHNILYNFHSYSIRNFTTLFIPCFVFLPSFRHPLSFSRSSFHLVSWNRCAGTQRFARLEKLSGEACDKWCTFSCNCVPRSFSPPFYQNNYHERWLDVQPTLISRWNFTFIKGSLILKSWNCPYKKKKEKKD